MPRSDPPRNCGFHTVEKKKSFAGYILKKLKVSKSSEATMPTVVRIATNDEPSRSALTKVSLLFLARNSGRMRVKAHPPAASARPSTATVISREPVFCWER